MTIRIITDSASDITDSYRKDLTVLPLVVRFGETEYQDGVNLSHRDFYEKLVECEDLPTTSQLSPYDFGKVFEQVRQAGERAIVITLSSKLSGTYQSAMVAAQDYEDVVTVVDSMNVTVGQRALVEYALRLKDEGAPAEKIVEKLEKEKRNIHLVALLDTLEYLKRGGRISPSVAFVGGLLSIKPVVAVQDGEVVMLGKARGSRQGNNLLAEQIRLAGGVDFHKPYVLGYTGLSDALMDKYIEDSRDIWQGHAESLQYGTVGSAIGTHVGPGAIAVAFFAASDSLPAQ